MSWVEIAVRVVSFLCCYHFFWLPCIILLFLFECLLFCCLIFTFDSYRLNDFNYSWLRGCLLDCDFGSRKGFCSLQNSLNWWFTLIILFLNLYRLHFNGQASFLNSFLLLADYRFLNFFFALFLVLIVNFNDLPLISFLFSLDLASLARRRTFDALHIILLCAKRLHFLAAGQCASLLDLGLFGHILRTLHILPSCIVELIKTLVVVLEESVVSVHARCCLWGDVLHRWLRQVSFSSLDCDVSRHLSVRSTKSTSCSVGYLSPILGRFGFGLDNIWPSIVTPMGESEGVDWYSL